MRKMKNSKGFTLMEMLIVVAIIAILVAIAIPTFNASLNKARVAADEANIRAGYASLMADLLTNENVTTGDYTLKVDGTVNTTGTAYTTKGKNDNAVTIGGISIASWEKDKGVKYHVDVAGTGNITVTITFE